MKTTGMDLAIPGEEQQCSIARPVRHWYSTITHPLALAFAWVLCVQESRQA